MDKMIGMIEGVGEYGLDLEASEGNGSYYVKLYDGSFDACGYDSEREAREELEYAASILKRSGTVDIKSSQPYNPLTNSEPPKGYTMNENDLALQAALSALDAARERVRLERLAMKADQLAAAKQIRDDRRAARKQVRDLMRQFKLSIDDVVSA